MIQQHIEARLRRLSGRWGATDMTATWSCRSPSPNPTPLRVGANPAATPNGVFGFSLLQSLLLIMHNSEGNFTRYDDSNNSRLLDRSAQLSRHFLINTCISLLDLSVSINFGSCQM